MTGYRASAALALWLSAALAGCSGGPQDSAPGAGGQQFAGLERVLGRDPPPTLIVMEQDGTPPERLAAELPVREARALLLREGRNGAVTTWRTLDAATLALRDPGVLVATRGLGDDLHIADAQATADALTAGRGGAVARAHLRLGGDQRLVRTEYACTLTAAGRETVTLDQQTRTALRFDESCTPADGGPGTGFTNSYWRDPAGRTLWRSRQWIGAELGHIDLRQMPD